MAQEEILENQGQEFGNWEREHGTRKAEQGIGKVEVGSRKQELELGQIGKSNRNNWKKKGGTAQQKIQKNLDFGNFVAQEE